MVSLGLATTIMMRDDFDDCQSWIFWFVTEIEHGNYRMWRGYVATRPASHERKSLKLAKQDCDFPPHHQSPVFPPPP